MRSFLDFFFVAEETRRFVAKSVEKNRSSPMKQRREAGDFPQDLSVKNLPKQLKIPPPVKPYGQELSWWRSCRVFIT